MLLITVDSPFLDDKDLDIINALFKYGTSKSARFLSKKINLPSRTISYRLKKLREHGLVKTYPNIYEYRLGLGDCTFFVETKNLQSVVKIFENIPLFYLIAATWGKYTGVSCSAVYSLNSPDIIEKFLENHLVETGLITDYYLLKTNQGVISNLDLSYYNHKTKTWDNWNWEDWKSSLKSQISQITVKEEVIFKNIHKPVKFDEIDIQILREIKKIFHYESASSIVYTHLSKKLGYSDTLIRRRIKRLEENQCIEYLANFEVPRFHEPIFAYIVIEGKDDLETQKILSIFYELPFQIAISLESQTKFSLFYRASAKELANFLWAIEDLRDFFEDIFLQLIPYYFNNRHHLYECYDTSTQSWKTIL
jgi:DNA-binding Lrp family transcriptional regulator